MKFDEKSNKVNVRYLYDNADPTEAQPTKVYDVANDRVIGNNTKPYLVGLSNSRNTPVKTETGLSMFHSEELEIDGTTHYYFTK